MNERLQQFEDALADLIDNAITDGVPPDEIISALETRKMVIEEDQAN